MALAATLLAGEHCTAAVVMQELCACQSAEAKAVVKSTTDFSTWQD